MNTRTTKSSLLHGILTYEKQRKIKPQAMKNKYIWALLPDITNSAAPPCRAALRPQSWRNSDPGKIDAVKNWN